MSDEASPTSFDLTNIITDVGERIRRGEPRNFIVAHYRSLGNESIAERAFAEIDRARQADQRARSEAVKRAATWLADSWLRCPITVVTILRLSFEHLGEHRRADHQRKNAAVQERAMDYFRLSPSAGHPRQQELLDEVLSIDWDKMLTNAQLSAAHYIGLLRDVIRIDEGDGHKGWMWAASLLAVAAAGVDRTLEDKLASDPQTVAALASLAKYRRSRNCSSIGRLTAYVIREHFLTETRSRPVVIHQLREALVDRTDEVIEAFAEHLTFCKSALEHLKTCHRTNFTLKGGLYSALVPHIYLGFMTHTLGGDFRSFAGLAPPVSRADQPSANKSKSSGPKALAYARGDWKSASVWDAVPLGARELRAQGQTRAVGSRRT